MTSKKMFEFGGYVAAFVLIAFGVAAIVMVLSGRNEVRRDLQREFIVGSPDMNKTAIMAEAKGETIASPRHRHAERQHPLLLRPARPAHLLCDIHRAAYSQREQNSCMARSGLDWHGWQVYAARPTTTVCSGGILYNSNRNYPAYRRLAYGSTWRFAAFTCHSQITGLTCTTSKGHGVFLSRQCWRGW